MLPSRREVHLPTTRQFSVVIPFRGRLDQLEQTLRSLATTDSSRRELIVVDDASGHDLGALCEEVGARLLVLPAHGGPSVARNTGARQARFDWLVFVDADICVPADCFEGFDQFLGEDEAVVGSCPIVHHGQSDGFISLYADEFFRFSILSQADRMLFTACCVLATESFWEAGGFDESAPLAFADDIVMGWRLAEAGCTFALVDTVEVSHLKTMSLWGFIRSRVLHAYYQAGFHGEYRQPSGPPVYSKPTGPLSALAIVCWLGCALLWPWWLMVSTPLFLVLFVAIHGAFVRFLAREKGLAFTGLAVVTLVGQYGLYTAAAVVGKLARLLGPAGRRRRSPGASQPTGREVRS